jgi:hypothetical protein
MIRIPLQILRGHSDSSFSLSHIVDGTVDGPFLFRRRSKVLPTSHTLDAAVGLVQTAGHSCVDCLQGIVFGFAPTLRDSGRVIGIVPHWGLKGGLAAVGSQANPGVGRHVGWANGWQAPPGTERFVGSIARAPGCSRASYGGRSAPVQAHPDLATLRPYSCAKA